MPLRVPSPFARRLFGVFLLALAVRMIHVGSIGKAPFARLLVGDARSYDHWAQGIASGDWIGKETFYQAPLYPYALAVLYRAAGHDPMTVRWAQSILGALACAVLALAGRRWFSDAAGLAAGALLALYPPAIFFDGLVQKAALDNLFMCLLLASLGAYTAGGRERWLPIAGAVLGAFALTRENALVFFVVLAAWLPFHLRERRWRARLAAVGLVAAGMACVLVPVGLRNKAVGGEFLITTSQAGSNFFIGNNEKANGRYMPIRPGREMPEFERKDATEVASQAAGRPLSPGQVSAYWWSRSFGWIAAHPGRWLRLLGTKLLLTWNRVELPDTENLEVYADFSWLLRTLSAVFGFAGLAVAGAAGMALAWKASPRPVLLHAMFFGFSGAVALFYVFARYRFPIVPILALFAGHAAAEGVTAWRAGSRRPAAPVVLASAAAAVIAWLPIVPGSGMRALAYENLGIGFSDDGQDARAIDFYRRSIELDPKQPPCHYNLAVVLARSGRVEEAATELVTTLRLDPSYADAHDNLGVLLAGRGNLADAERHFREAYRLDPSSPLTRVNLGNVALAQGRADEAIDWYRKALDARPDYLEARLNLIQAFEHAGRRGEAAAEAKEVLRRDPGNAEAKEALARLGGR